MKTILITLLMLLILIPTQLYAGCYYKIKPYKPIRHCSNGQLQLICSNEEWVWVCIDNIGYTYY